ncbi:MAG: flagellar basal body rod protein FlgC [Kangiellaceae bacterium]|nr:flagellar basal body rod protein FlgC [Kangiellaceae bacterium]
MGLQNIFNIAGSGMSAQSVRLNATASNMANANSVSSSTGETYKARHPIFAAVQQQVLDSSPQGALNGAAQKGVQVLGVVESDAQALPEYRPDHPLADAEGFIYRPNVNVVEEMADMISASRSYQTNVEVAKTAKDMLQQTLGLGK